MNVLEWSAHIYIGVATNIQRMFVGEEYTVRENKRGKNRIQKVINVSAKSRFNGDDEVVILSKAEWKEMQHQLQSLTDTLKEWEDIRPEYETLKSQSSEIETMLHDNQLLQNDKDNLEQMVDLIRPQLEETRQDNMKLKADNTELATINNSLSQQVARVEVIVEHYEMVNKYLLERNLIDRILNRDISHNLDKPQALLDWKANKDK